MTARLALIAAAVVTLLPAAAHPCLNADRLERDEAVKLVAKADKALEAGNARQAIRLLEPTEPGGAKHIVQADLHRRSQTILAVARIRVGSVDRGVRSLRRLLASDKQNPALLARLAEGLSRQPAGAAEARRVLEDLDRRDLVPDARAYLTLAELRDGAGDAAGRDQALGRCRAMARQPSMCVIGGGAPGGKVAPSAPRS